MEYWKQKKLHLLSNPGVAPSSVSLVLFQAESKSVGSALAEAFSSFSPYWKSVEAIINEEVALIKEMGEDYWHTPLLAELRAEDETALISRETSTQDLDTAVLNALDDWDESPETSKTPAEMNVSVPLYINFFDLGFFLEKETVARLKKMSYGLNIQFIKDEKFPGGAF